MTRIAVVTADVLAERMAGPAIRAFHIAEQLALAGHQVSLYSTASCSITDPRFACAHAPWHRLREAVGADPVVVFQGFVSFHAPWLLRSDKVLVVDLYDPMHLEQLEQLRHHAPLERRATGDLTVRVLNDQLLRGDFFLCASEEQRALWLGQLAAVGRLNAENYDADQTLRSLIAVCPFGLSDRPAVQHRHAVKGGVEGIGPEDTVLLWAGGVYNWFDPLTLVRAVGQLAPRHPDLRLFFLGMVHPNPDVPAMAVATRLRELSDELGLTGRSVFFNDGWVAYDDRENYLLDADVGVSTHLLHVETTFSFRTRMLDYLWAGLPMVATVGDSFSTLIEQDGLGLTVPEGDVEALAAALERAAYEPGFAEACRAAIAVERGRFTWPRALAPLVAFCAAPHRAPDADADRRRLVRRPVPPKNPVARDMARASTLLHQGGVRLLARQVQARGQRLWTARRGTGQ